MAKMPVSSRNGRPVALAGFRGPDKWRSHRAQNQGFRLEKPRGWDHARGQRFKAVLVRSNPFGGQPSWRRWRSCPLALLGWSHRLREADRPAAALLVRITIISAFTKCYTCHSRRNPC